MEASLLAHLTEMTLESIVAWTNGARAVPADAPAGLTLLLRRYAETGGDDLCDALGAALPLAIDLATLASDEDQRASWLEMFVHARRLSDDVRIEQTARELRRSIVQDWPSRGSVAPAMHAVDSVLSAGSDRTDEDAAGHLVTAIDELERVMGAAYKPGGGVSHDLDGSTTSGTSVDHTTSASALLNAYGVSGRLPYAMLADELMQYARRTWPDLSTAAAARVYAQLGALYADDEYRRTAVLADVDYSAAARQLLTRFADDYELCGGAAACALVLLDTTAER